MNKNKERLGVLLEEIRDKVQIIAEGHDVLRSEMKEMGNQLGGRIEHLEKGQVALSNKIDQVHTSLKNEIKVTFTALNEKLEDHIRQPVHAVV